MDRAYFQADEYVAYLREHCAPGTREDNGRVPGTDFSERILSEMRFRPGDQALEIGCGLGRGLQLLELLGLHVDRRLVFDRKDDIGAHRYRVTPGCVPPPERCSDIYHSDIYHIVEKHQTTPLDAAIQYQPSEVSQSIDA